MIELTDTLVEAIIKLSDGRDDIFDCLSEYIKRLPSDELKVLSILYMESTILEGKSLQVFFHFPR